MSVHLYSLTLLGTSGYTWVFISGGGGDKGALLGPPGMMGCDTCMCFTPLGYALCPLLPSPLTHMHTSTLFHAFCPLYTSFHMKICTPLLWFKWPLLCIKGVSNRYSASHVDSIVSIQAHFVIIHTRIHTFHIVMLQAFNLCCYVVGV